HNDQGPVFLKALHRLHSKVPGPNVGAKPLETLVLPLFQHHKPALKYNYKQTNMFVNSKSCFIYSLVSPLYPCPTYIDTSVATVSRHSKKHRDGLNTRGSTLFVRLGKPLLICLAPECLQQDAV